MRRASEILALLTFLTVFRPATARADQVVFSNLPSIAPFYQNIGYVLASSQSLAMSFTVAPGSGFDLTQFDVALTYVPFGGGGPNVGGTLELLNDSAGSPGSTVLGAWSFGALPSISTTTSTLQTISGISGIQLSGGGTYWLAAFQPNTSGGFTNDHWMFNNTSSAGPAAGSADGGHTWFVGSTQPQGAFDVLGTPVPEPSSILLLGSSLSVLGFISRRFLRV